ncbi:USF1 factor, partial [Oxyruncus cristatus]|nr:USF1 factor [Oxyruncus cristatus]
QVMYPGIQVADGQLDAQTEGTSAISGVPHLSPCPQAVIQGAFTSEEGVETEATPTETHYTYFPAGVADGGSGGTAATAATAVVTTQSSEGLLGQPT